MCPADEVQILNVLVAAYTSGTALRGSHFVARLNLLADGIEKKGAYDLQTCS